MRYRGIKNGQYIEILEQLDYIPDGTEIIVDLEFIDGQITEPRKLLTEQERLAKLNELFGTWQNQPELIEIFAEIDQERHAYRGRNIDSIEFGKIQGELRQIGKPTGELDALIASVVRSRNDTLVTNNTKDFINIPNLKLDNWIS